VTFNLPNLLSLFRMALVPVFVVTILDGNVERALWVFAVAGITDGLDGAIARIWKQQTVLGAYLDPAADKLLLVSAYVMLAIPNLHAGTVIPVWVSALVIARDIVIVVVALLLYLASGVTRFPPSPLSKVNTGSQVAVVLLVLLSGLDQRLGPIALFGTYAVAVLTVASGVDYILRANRSVGGRE
jgi:cardiolipin synthase